MCDPEPCPDEPASEPLAQAPPRTDGAGGQRGAPQFLHVLQVSDPPKIDVQWLHDPSRPKYLDLELLTLERLAGE